MASKQVAHGTLFKTDVTDGGSFATMTLVKSVTPPPRTREEIDGRTLDDDFEVPLMGIEMASEMSVMQFWEPGDTEHEKLDTAFGAKTDFPVQIVTPHATPVTDEFNVKVKQIEPAELTPNGTFQRTVTFQRTGDITRT